MVGAADIVADRLRRMGAEKDRTGIADFGRQRFGIRRHDLEMLGGNGVGQRHRLVEMSDHDDGAEIVPRGAGDVRARQRRKLAFHRTRDVGGEPRAVGDEDRLRARIMLGLRQQIGGDPVGIGAVVGDDRALAAGGTAG